MIHLEYIEKPQGITNMEHKQILRFMGNLVKSKQGVMSEGELYYLGDNKPYKILNRKLGEEFYKYEDNVLVTLQTKAMAKYMCGDQVDIKLLGLGKPISKTMNTVNNYKGLLNHYLYPFFTDKGDIGDALLYMWYDLFKHIRIQKRQKKGEGLNMYIGGISDMFKRSVRSPNIISEFSFDYYLSFSRDKLLEKEKELGYLNEEIGDKNRDYAYTHLLRQNAAKVGKIYTASAIRLIMGWSWFNCYVTSRKQGKTSFAADRIVAELFNKKPGYGRHNRKIKFFIDNASTIGNELLDFIDEIILPYKDKEISPGVKMFNINRSNQTVICNLTHNIFSVVSLHTITSKKNKSTGEGLACDCAIIDEGFRIDHKFWKSFRTRAREETEWILFVSTFNDETTPDHWAYNELIKGEAGNFKTHNTVRSSDFDNTITYMLKFYNKKHGIGGVYRKDPLALKQYDDYIWKNFEEEKNENDNGEEYVLKRFLCGISTEESLFDTTGRIVVNDHNPLDKDLRIIGMDMGGLSDKLGICVFNPKTLIVEKSEGLMLKDYNEVINIANTYKEQYPNSIFVGDLGGPVGNTVFLLDKKKVIDYWIKNDGNVETINEKEGYFIINKGILVLSGSYVLSNIIKVKNSCTGLIEGFGNMITKKSRTGKSTLYMGKKGKKDDEVFAYLIAIALLRQIFELNTGKEIQDFAKDHKEFGEYTEYEYDSFDELHYTTGVSY